MSAYVQNQFGTQYVVLTIGTISLYVETCQRAIFLSISLTNLYIEKLINKTFSKINFCQARRTSRKSTYLFWSPLAVASATPDFRPPDSVPTQNMRE